VSTTTTTREITAARRHSHRAGLRTVATIEATKGVLALLVAVVLSRAIRHDYDFEDLAARIFDFFHISLAHNWAHHLLNAADKISDWHPGTVLALAGLYSALRFVESYGLWRQRVWAEWLAIVSGAVYIPLELERLVRHPNGFHWSILIVNLAVVFYIAWVRWDEIKAKRAAKPAEAA